MINEISRLQSTICSTTPIMFCTLVEYFLIEGICQKSIVAYFDSEKSINRMCSISSFLISFPFRSPQNTESSSLYYTVGPHQLSIVYIAVCICQSQSPIHPTASFPLGIHRFVHYVCVSISALQTRSSLPFSQNPHIHINIQYVFLFLTYFTLYDSLQVHPHLCK